MHCDTLGSGSSKSSHDFVCSNDSDCPADVFYIYTFRIVLRTVVGCFSGGPGWQVEGTQIQRWEYDSVTTGEFFCTAEEAEAARDEKIPDLPSFCLPFGPPAKPGFENNAIFYKCEGGRCVLRAADNEQVAFFCEECQEPP